MGKLHCDLCSTDITYSCVYSVSPEDDIMDHEGLLVCRECKSRFKDDEVTIHADFSNSKEM